MKIIFGLGNKGDKYNNTRHNIGFSIIDLFQKELNITDTYVKKFDANISEVTIRDVKVMFVKPQTYMNLSGKTYTSIINFYNIPKEDTLVIHDDIDLPFSKTRYKINSSHGGQNGMRDIILKTGSMNIPRLKIGIGRHNYIPIEKWVLSKFSNEELNMIEKIFIDNKEKIYNFISSGFEGINRG